MKGNEFWVFESSQDKRTHHYLDDAVKSVKELLEADVDTEDITLATGDISVETGARSKFLRAR